MSDTAVKTDKEIKEQWGVARQMIVDAIQDKKGRGITVMDLSHIESAPAQEFIICEGRSPQQVAAIADNVREELLDKARIKPYLCAREALALQSRGTLERCCSGADCRSRLSLVPSVCGLNIINE